MSLTLSALINFLIHQAHERMTLIIMNHHALFIIQIDFIWQWTIATFVFLLCIQNFERVTHRMIQFFHLQHATTLYFGFTLNFEFILSLAFHNSKNQLKMRQWTPFWLLRILVSSCFSCTTIDEDGLIILLIRVKNAFHFNQKCFRKTLTRYSLINKSFDSWKICYISFHNSVNKYKGTISKEGLLMRAILIFKLLINMTHP